MTAFHQQLSSVLGVRWAVLSAYARSLPRGPERDRARSLALRARTGFEWQGQALVAARELGLIQGLGITSLGRDMALHFLAAEGVPPPRNIVGSVNSYG